MTEPTPRTEAYCDGLGLCMKAQARTEALDVAALDAVLEEAVSILANRGGYGWTDALHVIQKARAILAAKETP